MFNQAVPAPVAQTIDSTIAEHESMSRGLTNVIWHSYSTGAWNHIDTETVRSYKLNGLVQLQQGPEKAYLEGDAAVSMLAQMHDRFVNAAADAIHLARADKIEEAYKILSCQYARASRQVLWLLQNLKQRINPQSQSGGGIPSLASMSARSLPAFPA